MLDTLDIKIFGVVGILILLVIGYFVYLLYQDLVFLKKEVTELKQENWSSEEEQDDYSEQTEDEDDQEQDEELERHLATFMASQKENEFHQHLEPIQEIQEPEIELVQEEQVPEPQVKKRQYKKKAQAQIESEVEQTTEIEV
jgi:type III secretory pathway component EscV